MALLFQNPWQWAEPAALDLRGAGNHSQLVACERYGVWWPKVLEWKFWDNWPTQHGAQIREKSPLCLHVVLLKIWAEYLKYMPHLKSLCEFWSVFFGTFEPQFEQLLFSEAMPHGKNQRPGLGRKTWTSSWWITWAWQSWGKPTCEVLGVLWGLNHLLHPAHNMPC